MKFGLFLTVPVEQGHNFRDEKDKAQADDQGSLEEGEPHEAPHDTILGCARNGDVPAEQHITAEKAIPADEPCVAALSADHRCIIASDGEPSPENAPSSELVYKDNHY